jgi:hypothetical protein
MTESAESVMRALRVTRNDQIADGIHLLEFRSTDGGALPEFSAHREHATEEAGLARHLDLAQARQEQFVLHHAVLHFPALGKLGDGNHFVDRVGDRLLAIDVLAGLGRTGQQTGARLRRRRVDRDFVGRVCQRRVEIDGCALDAILPRRRRDFFCIAAD